GTGGGIKYASDFVKGQNFWVINGDTFFEIDLSEFYNKNKDRQISIALAEMAEFDRYGVVEFDNEKITAFKEKQYQKHGFINAGIYLLRKDFLHKFSPDTDVFSFEVDILEQVIDRINIGYYQSSSLFIDIGIPDDYYKSQYIFSKNLNKEKLFSLDSTWTIFLDRDGVINHRRPGSYVKNIEDFRFTSGAKEAMKKLSKHFKRIIVVTNQQGLGKGLMSLDELKKVNKFMLEEVEKSGGRIDGIYFCSQLATDKSNCRKPDPALAYQAKRDFPEIEFQKSIIFGDSISDIQFGKNLGMRTVLIPTKEEEQSKYPSIEVDWRIPALSSVL
ncbi:MAG TPA: HAD-IIIA family hydrolase, partial [Bacteroidetes bacterium]|nr:HAD-IIIA family hydrolase [Bacteroidota bacterium]